MTGKATERSALGWALAATLLWSTVATAFELALREVTVLQLVTGASVMSALCLGLILALRGRLRAAVLGLRSAVWRPLVCGAINPLAYYLVLFGAYDRLPPQIAQPLNYTWAIVLSLLSVVFLGRRLSRRGTWGIMLGYTGVTVVSLAGSGSVGAFDALGVALALGSSVLWAVYWLLIARDEREPVTALFQNFVVVLPLLVGLTWWFDGPPRVSLRALASLAYVGAFEMGLTFVLWQKALQSSKDVARTTNVVYLSPFLSLVWISFVLRETIHPLVYVGLALIVGGVTLQSGDTGRPRHG